MQRRLTLIGIAGIAALLMSCFARPPAELSGEEVLRRAIINTVTLDTVDIEATLSAENSALPLRITAAFTGTLAPLSHAWMIHLGGTIEAGVTRRVTAALAAASSRPGELYLRIDSLDGLSQSGSMPRGTWMLLSSGTGTVRSALDPRIVEAYASAFAVRQSTLVKEADGTYAYHLSVVAASGGVLGPAAAAPSGTAVKSITGVLTIDARTFRLLRADWMLESVPTSWGTLDMRLVLHFLRHNRAPLSLPVLSGSFVRPESIFDMISPR